MNKYFGRQFDIKPVYALTLDTFEDLILYTLEDYLFQTKFNKETTKINIPFAGISITQTKYFKLDLRTYFDIPQFSFDENGCLYKEGNEAAYVSPEFFAKCFIERSLEVWMALITLCKFQVQEKALREQGEIVTENLKGKKVFAHLDFIDIYNSLIAIKDVNQISTEGLIGLPLDINDKNKATMLRKIELAAIVQKCLQASLKEIKEYLFDYYQEEFNSFCQSDVYKKLEEEHDRLFRNGAFIEALEPTEWNRMETYDLGTDEERKQWQEDYQKAKKTYEEKDKKDCMIKVNSEVFSIEEIQRIILDYFKRQIIAYDYRRFAPSDNPYLTPLGLDRISYYAHPADKHIPGRTDGFSSSELKEMDSEYYNDMYSPRPEYYDDDAYSPLKEFTRF